MFQIKIQMTSSVFGHISRAQGNPFGFFRNSVFRFNCSEFNFKVFVLSSQNQKVFRKLTQCNNVSVNINRAL